MHSTYFELLVTPSKTLVSHNFDVHTFYSFVYVPLVTLAIILAAVEFFDIQTLRSRFAVFANANPCENDLVILISLPSPYLLISTSTS